MKQQFRLSRNGRDLVSPAPPYVLVTLTQAVWKVIETQPGISNQGCRGDCGGQTLLVFTPLPCYSATREANYPAVSSSRCRGDNGGKAQFVFRSGYVYNNHKRFSPGGSYSATSESIDHTKITVQLVRLMFIHNKTQQTKQRELFRSRDHLPTPHTTIYVYDIRV
jgi:hypothetical protein